MLIRRVSVLPVLVAGRFSYPIPAGRVRIAQVSALANIRFAARTGMPEKDGPRIFREIAYKTNSQKRFDFYVESRFRFVDPYVLFKSNT